MSIAPIETRSDMLAMALEYVCLGWSVIPIRPRDKKPLIKWEAYQQRQPTEDELRRWFTEWPDANIGIVTGSVSGMIVLDFDGSEGAKAISRLGIKDIHTPVVQTGNGAHFYLKHPGDLVRNYVKRVPGLDLRGDGGYVVAPPSVHASGRRYTFVPGRTFAAPLIEAPTEVLLLITAPMAKASEPTGNVQSLRPAVAPSIQPAYAQAALQREAGRVISALEGCRNDALNRAAFSLGQLIGAGELGREDVESTLMRTAVASGLPQAEALRTIESGLSAGVSAPRDMARVVPAVPWQEPRLLTFAPHRSGQDTTHAPPSETDAGHVALSDYRLDRLTAGEPPRREWLVQNAIPLGVPGVLFGAGGIGKSMVALDLALKVATRSQYGALDPITFIGRVPAEAAGASVFITLEDDKAEIHRRVANLDPDNMRAGAPCYVLPSLDIPGFDPAMIKQEGRGVALKKFAEQGLDDLLTAVREDAGCPIRLLMLDPAGDLIEGDEDSASTVKPLMRRLREIARRHGCTVILLGHVAKGETDRSNLAAKGMRGSGAWTANARFAIGVYAPDDNEKATFLRRLSIEPTPDNMARVVYGMVTKANFPGTPTGLMRFLRDPLTGAWIDYSDRARSEVEAEQEVGVRTLVAIVREAADVGLPFQIAGGSGLYKRKADLPEPIRRWGMKRLERLGKEALEKGLLVKCRVAGAGTTPCWLDTPDGPYATARRGNIATGSLADLLAKRRTEG